MKLGSLASKLGISHWVSHAEWYAMRDRLRQERSVTEHDLALEDLGARRRARSFLVPLIRQLFPQTRRIRLLDVGTGTASLLDELFLCAPRADLCGLDPMARGDWRTLPSFTHLHLSDADGLHLPFASAAFDLCISLGVFEHVGCTGPGMALPKPGMDSERKQFAQEILRVLKPGGHALITCPNKYLPLDFWHGMNRYGFRVHAPWERWTPSVRDVRRAFAGQVHASLQYLPQSGYYTFALASARRYPKPAVHLFGLYLRIAGSSTLLSTYFQPFLVLLVSKGIS